MVEYNTKKNVFDSYNNVETSYGPVINGQSMQNSYQVKAQQQAMDKAEQEKPFRETHASGVDY